MRILVLSHFYDPEPNRKATELAEALTARGHEVVVLTNFPNYPTGVLADGYRLALRRRDEVNGVPVIRTFVYPYHGRSAIGRIANYMSAMLSACLGGLTLGRFDAMYVWHPPLTIGVAAWFLGFVTRAPFVYDVQDIWPEVAVTSGLLREGTLVRILYKLERFVYARAAHLLVVTEGARQNLIRKGVPPARVSIGSHWIDDDACDVLPPEVRERVRTEQGWHGRFVVLFAGNIGLVQGLDTVLHAACELHDAGILLAFVGDGADRARLQELSRTLGVDDVVSFLERRPVSEMPPLMTAADALLVHLKRTPTLRDTIPSKTFSYLAAGRPIVMAIEGEGGDLVNRVGAGVVTPADDPPALARAIRDLAAQPEAVRQAMGERGRAYASANLVESHVIPQYEEVLARIAAERRAR
jgi:glycosyltransferase involved in cell wall biosynthesis